MWRTRFYLGEQVKNVRERSTGRGVREVLHTVVAEGGPAGAGPQRSIPSVVIVRTWFELHEAMDLGAVGKEPDDLSEIIDTIDQHTHYAECRCL